MARMMPTSGKYILSKYKLNRLKRIEDFVAECVEINVPFNNPITRFYAFTHKAGVHANAILNDPSTCEILKPEDSRVDQLCLKMTDAQIEECTAKLESMADLKVMSLDESDALIRSFHLELQNENGA
ncbi:probable homocitrate synthase, mitochondrial precursor [Fusarium fujikuroi]|nr:probable homocitrate synthase, mitochondrial precursor [Fusarium fujikuroi]SCO04404.1 probable homocitrate synthase, mitochondrial precursor [Fusarium fujikuroi]SCO07265.1 probable homocitrate synthase, mitochondrial precursor [Fusarium fujikuroi]SCO44607.1 probable homocitrate synthase, mitochondrial precursor [Fusarium fujikuroi]SCO57755.1 probable homocitrate synthase, mitochondrial precursor [Fusarium fujikuroi]